MKKQFRTAMLSTVCMLVVAVLSLTGVTYAWFTSGEKATVTGMTMNVDTADGGVEVSLAEDGDYGSTLEIITNTDLVMPLSTTNAVDFFDVELNPEKTSEIKTKSTNSKGDYVIVQELWLRNSGAQDIWVNLANTKLTSTENSKNANATSDIVNAARIAVLDASNTVIGGFYSPQTSEETYYAIGGITNDYFAMYGEHTPAEGGTSVTKPIAVVGLEDIVIKLPKMTDSTTYNPVKITVVIWVEGQDRNANNQNAGGAFDIEFNFTKCDEPTENAGA